MKSTILFLSFSFVFFSSLEAQNLVLYTTLNDAGSVTSPNTGPAGTQNSGSFVAAKYGNGFLSDAGNANVQFDIGASTGTQTGKLNQNKGTVAFWFKPNYNFASATQSGCLFSLGGYASFFLEYIYDDLMVDRYFTFAIQGSARAYTYYPVVNWLAGDLVHIAVVWDAAGSNTNINGGKSGAIYINGTVVASDNTTWTPAAINTTNLFIGNDSFGSSLYANGAIDDFYVYDYVLTSAQINSLKDAPLPVELTSFTAKATESSVALHWQTATEINNYGFEIERIRN